MEPLDSLLKGLDGDARRVVLAAARPRTIRSRQVLFRMGEPARHLFLMRNGRLVFTRHTSAGQDVLLGILGPGDLCGIGSLLSTHDYIGTAEALDDGDVLVWTKTTIRQLAARYPRISRNVLQMALYYAGLLAQMREVNATGSADERLGAALTRLAGRVGSPTPSVIDVRIGNEQLASLANVSPFTVSRVLKRWQRHGILIKDRGLVRLINPQQLLFN
jgi:CRP-like cAMP-binding protein